MARNANVDKAKRQAVGIYRAASPQAKINKGIAEYSGGDYRVPEGAKACYHNNANKAADRALVALYLAHGNAIKPCNPCENSKGRLVVPNDLNRKRAGADPQNRSELIPGKAQRAGSRLIIRQVFAPSVRLIVATR